jgi:ABC-type polysaccharide transport system, permease component
MDAKATYNRKGIVYIIKRYWILYCLLLPGVLFLAVFKYYPILLQAVLSFKDYRLMDGLWGSKWVGFKNFVYIISSPDMLRIIWNTINISLLRLLVGFLPPIILSIMLFDLVGKKLKRITQTIVYIPHFFSWTVVYAVTFAIFSNSGIVNSAARVIGLGSYDYLMSQKAYLPLLLGSALWKEIGWNTIIYLAALTSVNTELYEVAKIDGAGPLKRIWHVTIPGISSVIIFLLILSLGNILRGAGTEQILLFYSPPVYNISDIMDTWVYREGLSKIQYSMGSAVTFFQSVFGLVLVLVCNKISIKTTKVGIW